MTNEESSASGSAAEIPGQHVQHELAIELESGRALEAVFRAWSARLAARSCGFADDLRFMGTVIPAAFAHAAASAKPQTRARAYEQAFESTTLSARLVRILRDTGDLPRLALDPAGILISHLAAALCPHGDRHVGFDVMRTNCDCKAAIDCLVDPAVAGSR